MERPQPCIRALMAISQCVEVLDAVEAPSHTSSTSLFELLPSASSILRSGIAGPALDALKKELR